jgi:outer membrane protein TolC
VAAVLCLASVQAVASSRLTLDAVLALADAAHPDLDLARAREEAAQAEARLASSLNDFRVSIEGTLRTGRNPVYDDTRSDNKGSLVVRKTLYDGGVGDISLSAAREETSARALQVMDARAQRRLTLMARYFDVLLADMAYNADTEFMAVAYVDWDNNKDRHALGQTPQWKLLELEARYQDALAQRNDTRRKLREKRMQLAQAMNRDAPVLEDLVDPPLKDNDRKLPEYDVLMQHALARNPGLQAQSRLLAATQVRRETARAILRPTLEVTADATDWSRESTTRDDMSVGLNFYMPLWQSDRMDARLAREQARITEIMAQQEKMVMDLRESVLSLWEEIQHLQGSARRSAQLHAQSRDLALEKARAEYEMELKTNLGNSMAETQMAHLRRRSVEYRLALAWARLEALLGTPLTEVKAKDKS